jgi:phosphoglycolate phosphatase
MTAHQVLLFDLDGTLTDPKSGITKSIQYALAQFDVDETDLATLTSFIGPPLTESFQKYYGFDAVQAEQALLFYREYFTNGGMYDNAVYPGIINLLTALTAQEKRLLVATSKPTVFAEQILAHFQLDTYFEQIIGSNLDGTRTTKTEIIAYTLATVPTIARSATIMIGDRKHDICGARDNGLPSIAVGYGYGTLDELVAATPTYLVPTVEQLAKLLQGE